MLHWMPGTSNWCSKRLHGNLAEFMAWGCTADLRTSLFGAWGVSWETKHFPGLGALVVRVSESPKERRGEGLLCAFASRLRVCGLSLRVAMLGSNTIGRILFMNIFKIAPGAVDLFPFAKGDAHMWRPGSPLEVHALKVVETVATAVSLLKDLDTLVPILQSLGLKHVGYGVEKAHYDVVGQALIATLEVALTRHFTEPVKNAYLKVWTIVKNTMISDNYGG